MRTLFTILLLFGLGGALNAQGYTVSDGPLAYTPLTGGTVQVLTEVLTKNGEGPIQFPGAPFPFFGATRPEFAVYRTGHIHFWNQSTGFAARTAPSGTLSRRIAPFWWNLEASPTSQIAWDYVGTEMIVEWKEMIEGNIDSKLPPPNPNLLLTFQLRMDSATGRIEFRYAAPVGGAVAAKTSPRMVGLREFPLNRESMPISNGVSAGYVNTDGSLAAWPSDRYIRFDPIAGGGRPTITVKADGAAVRYHLASTSGVMIGDKRAFSIGDANFTVLIDDPDGDQVSVTAEVGTSAATPANPAEWSNPTGATPYTLYPTQGDPEPQKSIGLKLVADDGTYQVMFYFVISDWRLTGPGGKLSCTSSAASGTSGFAAVIGLLGLVAIRRRRKIAT